MHGYKDERINKGVSDSSQVELESVILPWMYVLFSSQDTSRSTILADFSYIHCYQSVSCPVENRILLRFQYVAIDII